MIQNYNKSYEICYPSGTKMETYKHNHICDAVRGQNRCHYQILCVNALIVSLLFFYVNKKKRCVLK